MSLIDWIKSIRFNWIQLDSVDWIVSSTTFESKALISKLSTFLHHLALSFDSFTEVLVKRELINEARIDEMRVSEMGISEAKISLLLDPVLGFLV